MKLKPYMNKKRLSNQQFANIIEEKTGFKVDRTYVSRLRNGLRSPSLALGLAIEDATGGKVRVGDWR